MRSDWFGLPWWLWGCAALGVAVLYSYHWPKPRSGPRAPAWLRHTLRVAHSCVWLLLAGSCFVRACSVGAPPAAVSWLQGAALFAYLLFLTSILYDRRLGSRAGFSR